MHRKKKLNFYKEGKSMIQGKLSKRSQNLKKKNLKIQLLHKKKQSKKKRFSQILLDQKHLIQ
jgi:formamidopyrimidine-DNA glycosylase